MASQAETVSSRQAVLDYINSQMVRFRATYHVRKIALIGSFARNEQTSSSDIDLLVDLERGTPNIHQVKQTLKTELEGQFGRTVEIASERYLKPYYRKQILQEAIYVQ
jgi:predicted nucleotidyltransferase